MIGGVGGSGTRLIARCLKESGFYLGGDLNSAYDNLWFTLLFKRIEILSATDVEFNTLVDILINAMAGNNSFTDQQIKTINLLASSDRQQHPAHWLRKQAKNLLSCTPPNRASSRWGWKEPNTHIVIDRLAQRIQGLKYIHVARNGLDMAYSKNQNQLRLWGPHLLKNEFAITPRCSLAYWCQVHRRVLHIGESMAGNFLFLNYDQFCVHPGNGVRQLLNFVGVQENSLLPKLEALVKQPRSIGRFKKRSTNGFAEQDIAFVRSLGFDVNHC